MFFRDTQRLCISSAAGIAAVIHITGKVKIGLRIFLINLPFHRCQRAFEQRLGIMRPVPIDQSQIEQAIHRAAFAPKVVSRRSAHV